MSSIGIVSAKDIRNYFVHIDQVRELFYETKQCLQAAIAEAADFDTSAN